VKCSNRVRVKSCTILILLLGCEPQYTWWYFAEGPVHEESPAILREDAELCAGSATIQLMHPQVNDRLADVLDKLKGASDNQLDLIQHFR
jgi:hypothetical protein